MIGQLLGSMAGTMLAIAVVLLIPGNQEFWEGLLLCGSLSIFGSALGRMAWDKDR